MKKTFLPFVAATLLIMGCGNSPTTPAPAGDTGAAKEDTATGHASTETPPDSATMMKNWMAYMTPGKPHELMASWNGNWTGEVSMWHAPGTPPDVSQGTASYTMALGGRYQLGKFTGSMMGQSFEGMSTVAYDNSKKVFISIWADNVGTGLMVLEGPWDEASKSMTLTGKCIDPSGANGKEMVVKEIFKIVDADHQIMEMYCPGYDGKEFKTMEIKYTRKK